MISVHKQSLRTACSASKVALLVFTAPDPTNGAWPPQDESTLICKIPASANSPSVLFRLAIRGRAS
jgi:hypothetical protein